MTANAQPSTIPLAMALLDRQWPEVASLAEQPGADALAGLRGHPRYVIGRLQQALTTLLAGELPAMDSQTALLSQAPADAIAWRLHYDRFFPRCGESLCEQCGSDWDQADRYHALARSLGAVGDVPSRAASSRPGCSLGCPAGGETGR
jgi:hypothetical protein